MTIHHPLVTTASDDLTHQNKLLRARQRELLAWLDELVTDAQDAGSAVVVVGAAVVRGKRQQLRDSLR